MKVTVKKTISLPADLLRKARSRAREDNRSFSSYVQHLLSLDIKNQRLEPVRR